MRLHVDVIVGQSHHYLPAYSRYQECEQGKKEKKITGREKKLKLSSVSPFQVFQEITRYINMPPDFA